MRGEGEAAEEETGKDKATTKHNYTYTGYNDKEKVMEQHNDNKTKNYKQGEENDNKHMGKDNEKKKQDQIH
eukprot:1240693-Heterocapsa_arctica.AAC.1